MQKVYVVTASVNELDNLKSFSASLNGRAEVIVIDEGDERLRERNRTALDGLRTRFFGPREREEWFKGRFGDQYDVPLSVIPQRCHAETSFGFLVALEELADFVVELDDDVFPVEGYGLLEHHIRNLNESRAVFVSSDGRWYNTLENLELSGAGCKIFPRGHPYSKETRDCRYSWRDLSCESVLNMGLWLGNPDLDALTIIAQGGLDGRCDIKSLRVLRPKVVVAPENFFSVCSMNAAFRSKVIPAFYQLYMNFMGIDRFDDIWSGIFLKRIADHLGETLSLGLPPVYHSKRPRSSFKDLRSELEGMALNETLWKVVGSLEIEGDDYLECYSELTEGLAKRVDAFKEKTHRDFISLTAEKMRLWTRVVEKVS
jgi:hypothetical protein